MGVMGERQCTDANLETFIAVFDIHGHAASSSRCDRQSESLQVPPPAEMRDGPPRI